MSVEILAKLYEEKMDQLQELNDETRRIRKELDEKREFVENWVWCYHCNKRHRPWSDVARTKHRTVKIPKQCLTKYDHIYKRIGGREEPETDPKFSDLGSNLMRVISISECIVCGKRKEEVWGWT